MSYVDGFLAPVETRRKDDFIAHARIMHAVMREFGALSIMDCWGDDVPDGKVTSMRMAVQAKPDETVAFAWIVWPDKATRDKGMEQMMSDPRMSQDTNPMPFDGQRVIFGGFEPIVETP